MRSGTLIPWLLALTIIAGAKLLKPTKLNRNSSRAVDLWEQYKTKYGKHYDVMEEDSQRMEAFLERLYQIELHNRKHDMGLSAFRMGLNERSDWLVHEYEHHGKAKKFTSSTLSENEDQIGKHRWSAPMNVQVPESIDWREHGFVTPIKNQQHCGSCWAFSATGALEAQHKRKTGKLVSLSEQNLVDCSEEFGNYGCLGGYIPKAFDYVQANRGIDTEESYPYMATEGKCQFNVTTIGATSVGYQKIASGDETVLKLAVATEGPVAVRFDADHESFFDYKQGVYYEEKCSTEYLPHAMLVVGYGIDEKHGIKYWLIKNSYGKTWGEAGYMRVVRDQQNHCGVASMAVFPVCDEQDKPSSRSCDLPEVILTNTSEFLNFLHF